MSRKTVWLTGGMGYIGSHVAVELLRCFPEYVIVLVDDLSNSHEETVDRVKQLSGSDNVCFAKCDIRDSGQLTELARECGTVDACIHFAALKNVAESVEMPMEYYDVNVTGTISLLQVLRRFGCNRVVLSSSCSVYGVVGLENLPVTEGSRLQPICPYAFSKVVQEQILRDLHVSDPAFSAVVLRYFNPVSAHPSGLLGERPKKTRFNNLFPLIVNAALDKSHLKVFGNDFQTRDGSPVRDYIHIMDLAEAHVAALAYLLENESIMEVVNIGTGRGVTVLELVDAFEKENGVEVPHEVVGRRQGDVEAVYADSSRAMTLLGWRAKRSVQEMCRDAWAYAAKHQST